jgi:hypothetical protein
MPLPLGRRSIARSSGLASAARPDHSGAILGILEREAILKRCRIPVWLVFAVLALALVWRAPMAANPDDRHEGYYYPMPGSVEAYVARVNTLPDSDRKRRLGFVIGITKEMMSGRYAPNYAVFAKGDDAEKLIVVGLIDGQLNTVYRARAFFAMMTAASRVTPFFQENTIAEDATFFDLLKLLGFKQVTITDGVAFAHQVLIE